MASMSDSMMVKLSRQNQNAPVDLDLPKNEVVLALAASKEDALKNVKEWVLYLALTQFRTVVTLHLLFDLESILKRLPLLFESTELTPSSIEQEIVHVYGLIEEMKVKRGIALESFYTDIGDGDIFHGFNLEEREEGEAQFELDGAEILTSTFFCMKGRFDPLLTHPILTWMRDSLEHRLWPPTGSAALESWGIEALKGFCNHFSELQCMKDFGIVEALYQWSRLKQDLSGKPFFVLPFRKFWEHVSAHYDNLWGYSVVIVPI